MFLKQVAKKENMGVNQGFTLIEVLIAMVILSVGILAIASMQIQALTGNSVANSSTIRVVSAQHKLEELISLPFDDPKLEIAGNSPGTDSDGNTHQEATADGYTIRWDITDDDPIANAKRITVRVKAPSGSTTQVIAIKAS